MKTLMTKSLVLIALGVASSNFALADDKMTPAKLQPVQVESVTSYVTTAPGMKTTMHVEAVAVFSNSCFAPATERDLAILSNLNKDNVNYEVNLYQLGKEGSCIDMYAPVRKTINIADVLVANGQPEPLILPQFAVNGVKAKIQSK